MQWRTWTWNSGTFCTAVKQLSEPKKRHQDCLMASAQSFYGLCLWLVAHSLTCSFSGNVPLLHTSRYVTALTQFYQASPALELQATNAGVRRPGTRLIKCIVSNCMHFTTVSNTQRSRLHPHTSIIAVPNIWHTEHIKNIFGKVNSVQITTVSYEPSLISAVVVLVSIHYATL